MHGSVNDAVKAKARAAAEAKKKSAEEEKKLSALQQCLSKIKKATLDEHNWPKYWIEIKDWSKSDSTRNITTAWINSYPNTPIIDNFGTLKEEAAKFLVSQYHDGKIWLDQPITINARLINLGRTNIWRVVCHFWFLQAFLRGLQDVEADILQLFT